MLRRVLCGDMPVARPTLEYIDEDSGRFEQFQRFHAVLFTPHKDREGWPEILTAQIEFNMHVPLNAFLPWPIVDPPKQEDQ
jgi:hypothetical protein